MATITVNGTQVTLGTCKVCGATLRPDLGKVVLFRGQEMLSCLKCSAAARREAEREASADFGRAAAAEGRKPDGDRARREAERRSRQLARSGPKGGMAFPSGKKSGKKSR